MTTELAQLRDFKAYVHGRLDKAGVPVDPESPHKSEGCRIGGRIDFLLGLISEMRTVLQIVIEADDLAKTQLSLMGLELDPEITAITERARAVYTKAGGLVQ